MAVNHTIAPTEHDHHESQGSTLNTSFSSDDEESFSCKEQGAEHAEIDMVVKRIRRRPTRRRNRAISFSQAPPQRTPPTCGRNSRRPGRSDASYGVSNKKAESIVTMKKRLHVQLNALGSLLPPTARTSRTRNVVADALRYRKALEKEIELLLTALPYSHQVDVRRVDSGGLQIGISCKKKSGLMVALIEAMESFGLHFANVSVSCQDDNIIIDAISTQESVEKAGALKGMLVATISRFSRR